MLMVVFSLVCSASPFGNISSMIGEDWALISWEYWGPEKNFSAQYRLNDSKQRNANIFLSSIHRWQETPTSLLAYAGE